MKKMIKNVLMLALVLCMICTSSAFAATNYLSNGGFDEYTINDGLIVQNEGFGFYSAIDTTYVIPNIEGAMSIAANIRLEATKEAALGTYRVYLAYYNSEKVMKKVAYTDVTLSAVGTAADADVYVNLSEPAATTDTVSAFVWSTDGGYIPYSNAVKLEETDDNSYWKTSSVSVDYTDEISNSGLSDVSLVFTGNQNAYKKVYLEAGKTYKINVYARTDSGSAVSMRYGIRKFVYSNAGNITGLVSTAPAYLPSFYEDIAGTSATAGDGIRGNVVADGSLCLVNRSNDSYKSFPASYVTPTTSGYYPFYMEVSGLNTGKKVYVDKVEVTDNLIYNPHVENTSVDHAKMVIAAGGTGGNAMKAATTTTEKYDGSMSYVVDNSTNRKIGVVLSNSLMMDGRAGVYRFEAYVKGVPSVEGNNRLDAKNFLKLATNGALTTNTSATGTVNSVDYNLSIGDARFSEADENGWVKVTVDITANSACKRTTSVIAEARPTVVLGANLDTTNWNTPWYVDNLSLTYVGPVTAE
ncbi:MAG: hypothetical protein J6D26_06165 [Clostridia bacterium]|nr:hypothetical protein [Clostridia bacterium]